MAPSAATPVVPTRIQITEQMDIVRARAEAKRLVGLIGLGPSDQTRLATAVSELARNILQYAGKGQCEISNISTPAELGVRIVFEDSGPGIPDVACAMRDGYSTSGGLGAGLPGTQRLMDRFEIDSRPGRTRVSIALIRRRL
ncbi:MAG: anti-sigma regulatory factor [Deltaproteobacteria bacterium]|nr:anti-sigma regulatory factor [Candidatus Anaeroferrophillacea bacterium]